MKNKLLLGMVASCLVIVLILIGFLIGTSWKPNSGNQTNTDSIGQPIQKQLEPTQAKPVATPGQTVERASIPNPPPPPKPVANPDRFRQNLQPGKTYVTHTRGTMFVRATDKDWGIEEVVTINFLFEAQIDREIESNDGKTIVEVRHFRDIHSAKFECRLEDIRIDLGPVGAVLLPNLQGSLHGLISGLRWIGISPEKIVGLADSMKVFTSVDRLSGKSVRLTYEDGKGVLKVEPVKGDMTSEERDFHMASVLVSDSLIIPDIDIKIGNRWAVDGSNFSNLIDPGLLARTTGEIMLERTGDQIVQNKNCRHLKAVSGRLQFEDSDQRVGVIGNFEPQGDLFFSPDDQVIIAAKLQGRAKLEKFSKDHLLFEARMRRMPELTVDYTCRIVDSLKK